MTAIVLAYARFLNGPWWRRRLECLFRGHAWVWRFYYEPPKGVADFEGYGSAHVNADCDCCGAFRKERQRVASVLLDYMGCSEQGGPVTDRREIRP